MRVLRPIHVERVDSRIFFSSHYSIIGTYFSAQKQRSNRWGSERWDSECSNRRGRKLRNNQIQQVIAAGKRALDTHGAGLSSVRFICGTQDIHKVSTGESIKSSSLVIMVKILLDGCQKYRNESPFAIIINGRYAFRGQLDYWECTRDGIVTLRLSLVEKYQRY